MPSKMREYVTPFAVLWEAIQRTANDPKAAMKNPPFKTEKQ